jgi:hypothetical protein
VTSAHDGATAPQGEEIAVACWIYHSGYYDGPLSGMVRLADGREVWAECIEECHHYDEDLEFTDARTLCGFYRRYQLWRLSDESRAIEAERHADFRRWVGTHTDRDEPARIVHPQAMWTRFYAKWKARDVPAHLDGAQPIGWFES